MKPMLIAVAVLGLCSCTTVRDLPKEQRQVVQVHEVAGVPKDQLYVRASVWFAKTFHDSKAVIQMQDKDAGTIVGKGIIPRGVDVGLGVKIDLLVTMTFEAKDGRFRSTFDDYVGIMDNGQQRDLWTNELDSAKASCATLDGELFTALSEKPKDF